jgi:hypothetical protein
MKFLNVFCENRKAEVFISLDKILLIQKEEEGCRVEVEGLETVVVRMPAEDLVRKINGEDKTTIGFRTGR